MPQDCFLTAEVLGCPCGVPEKFRLGSDSTGVPAIAVAQVLPQKRVNSQGKASERMGTRSFAFEDRKQHRLTSQVDISMVQTTSTAAKIARRKLIIQLVTFAAIAQLYYLKPHVEAWVAARQLNADNAIVDTESNPKTTDPATAPSTLPDATPDVASTASEPPFSSGDAAPQNSDSSESPASKPRVSKSSNERADVIVAAAEETSAATPTSTAKKSEQRTASPKKTSNPTTSEPAAESKTASKPASGSKSDISKMDRSRTKTREVTSDAEKNNPPPADRKAASDPALGKLKEIENNVFESTAGLVYVPGSADGHRLKHVMQHAKDNPQKEVHGVFDGDRDEILAVIDEAWTRAQKGGSDVRSEKQNNRRVYTVNLKRRVGQVGGRQGERQGNPECRYIRIVLENENEVVTAYPAKSF